MKFFRIIFQSFFLTVHIVIVILFLLAALSDRISPETFTLGAYLGLGFPVFCILNLSKTHSRKCQPALKPRRNKVFI